MRWHYSRYRGEIQFILRETSASCKIILNEEEAQLTASACTAEDRDDIIGARNSTQEPPGSTIKTQVDCIITPMEDSVRIQNFTTRWRGRRMRERDKTTE